MEKCHEKCATCNTGPTNTKTNCKTCISGKTFPLKNDTQCESNVPEGSFQDSTGKIVECYYRCDDCKKEGNHIKMNCDSCAFQYIPDPDIPGNCIVVKCDSYWDKPSPSTKECLNECKDYVVSSTLECLKKCSDGGLYAYQGECILFCPIGTHVGNNGVDCLSNSIQESQTESKCDIPYDQLPDFIDANIKELPNLPQPITGSDYYFNISSADEKPKIPGASLPAVDMSECTKLLLEANNIPNTDILKMIKIVGGNNDFKPDFAVYDAQGIKT